MTSIELTWAAACAGSSSSLDKRNAIATAAAGPRVDRVRHVAWAQPTQGRSVFTGTNPIAHPVQVQAYLRPELVRMNDGKVWDPDPWRPPPV